MKTKQDIQEQISALVINQLEQGIAPWRKPFSAEGILPTSLTTGKTYGGINLLLLSIFGQQYSKPLWLTYREAERRGGHVMKGQKGYPVIKWSMYDSVNKDTLEVSKRFFLKEFTVFNLEQCEGVTVTEEFTKREPVPTLDGVTNMLASYASKPTVYHRASADAYYSPMLDSITLPLIEQFNSGEEYAHTLAHELIHSTGHQSRLDRFSEEDQPARFGSAVYAKEELVADIGAQMLLASVGIEGDIANSASYVAGWLRALKNDSTLILSASTKAQKASDYIMAKVKEEVSA
jgi:antirestriction protein ArdC